MDSFLGFNTKDYTLLCHCILTRNLRILFAHLSAVMLPLGLCHCTAWLWDKIWAEPWEQGCNCILRNFFSICQLHHQRNCQSELGSN